MTKNDGKSALENALLGAKLAIKQYSGRKNIKVPRVIPVPKKIGGAIPLLPIFAGLSALGSLAGGSSGIVKAINDLKEAKNQLKESERHNKMMESIAMGKGVFLAPYKRGSGLYLNPYKNGGGIKRQNMKKKIIIILPNHPFNNVELLHFANLLKIPYFRGVYMRNSLPSLKTFVNESAIMNLNDKNGRVTH